MSGRPLLSFKRSSSTVDLLSNQQDHQYGNSRDVLKETNNESADSNSSLTYFNVESMFGRPLQQFERSNLIFDWLSNQPDRYYKNTIDVLTEDNNEPASNNNSKTYSVVESNFGRLSLKRSSSVVDLLSNQQDHQYGNSRDILTETNNESAGSNSSLTYFNLESMFGRLSLKTSSSAVDLLSNQQDRYYQNTNEILMETYNKPAPACLEASSNNSKTYSNVKSIYERPLHSLKRPSHSTINLLSNEQGNNINSTEQTRRCSTMPARRYDKMKSIPSTECPLVKLNKNTSSTLHISNLPLYFTDERLIGLCSYFGTVSFARVLIPNVPKINAFAYVLYDSRVEAQRALEGLNGSQIDGEILSARIFTSATCVENSEVSPSESISKCVSPTLPNANSQHQPTTQKANDYNADILDSDYNVYMPCMDYTSKKPPLNRPHSSSSRHTHLDEDHQGVADCNNCTQNC